MVKFARSAWVTVACLCAATAAVGAPPEFVYTTREGDTLIDLAQRFLTQPQDWPRLAQINHVANPRRMPVGTPLRIPESLMRSVNRDGTVLEAVGDATWGPAPAAGDAASVPRRPVRKGEALPAGSTVRTGGNGYVTVQLADGSVLRIQADTQAKLDTSRQYEAAGFFSSVWEVLQGRVEALVTHLTGGEPRFQIKTPQALLGVRGTEFRVAAQDGITRDETLSGAVAVQGALGEPKAGSGSLVKAGFGTLVDADQKVATPVPLLPAPVLKGQPVLHERILVRFDIPAVPGAVQYRAQVAEDEAFRIVRSEVGSATPVLRFGDLPDGDHLMRVRAVDARGLEGADAVHRFRLKARPEAPIPNEPPPGSKWRSTSVTLKWSEHPQALRYRLQVATTPDFQHLVLDRSDLVATQLTLPLPVGDYHWRLGTIAAGPNATPDAGPWGDAQHFAVRPLPAAPPPPQVDDEHIRFQLQGEPGQRFEFQLARDEAFRELVAEQSSSEALIALAKPHEGGRFLVRFRAIDADGYVGPYTAPQAFTLPSCIRSGSGLCVSGGSRFTISPP